MHNNNNIWAADRLAYARAAADRHHAAWQAAAKAEDEAAAYDHREDYFLWVKEVRRLEASL